MRRRQAANLAAHGALYAFAALALIPLALVLFYVAQRGLKTALNPDFYLNSFRPLGIPGAGVNHAIWGTAMLVGMASLLALPVGVISGVYV